MVTRPAVMSSSLLRREAMPEAARIFWRRSCGMRPSPGALVGILPFSRWLAARCRRCGFAQGFDLREIEKAIAAAWNSFERERAECNANPFFNGVMLLGHDAAERFFFCVSHADFVPVIGDAAAGRA